MEIILHRHGLWALAFLLSSVWLAPSISFGQTPITPSGLNTQVSGPIAVGGQTQFNITGGTRPGGGPNLFHSFGNFNVPNNNIANFLNNSGLPTSNILGRVTGGNVSNIFGTIQTTGFGNANLFLMNPAGFLFGPNATLNVGGMVAFTSADYLRLADGGRFNAKPNARSADILTAAPVAAFGFLGSNPGAIYCSGQPAGRRGRHRDLAGRGGYHRARRHAHGAERADQARSAWGTHRTRRLAEKSSLLGQGKDQDSLRPALEVWVPLISLKAAPLTPAHREHHK